MRTIWKIAALVAGSTILMLTGSAASVAFVQHTGSVDFCISCHEMRDTVYEEYKKSAHYNNVHGVRAACADCHVPHTWWDTAVRKVYAAKDIAHHLLGTIDTVEKFDARRRMMAERVWANMKENNSRECRNCHSFDAMSLPDQKPRARKQHENAQNDGSTCIDCHKGIAHKAVHQQAAANDAPADFSLQF